MSMADLPSLLADKKSTWKLTTSHCSQQGLILITETPKERIKTIQKGMQANSNLSLARQDPATKRDWFPMEPATCD